eukprot:1811327-Karenia_brevis.AAC.1
MAVLWTVGNLRPSQSIVAVVDVEAESNQNSPKRPRLAITDQPSGASTFTRFPRDASGAEICNAWNTAAGCSRKQA